MRTIILMVVIMFVTSLKAQTDLPLNFSDYNHSISFRNNIQHDILPEKKWSLIRYSSISTGFAFFKGGNATIVSVPVGLQLNRRLNNNFYAFANVSVAPSYINFNRSFINADLNKNNQYNNFRYNRFGMYSSASLGLMYINNDKTFSISGSISIERNNYPIMPIYQAIDVRPNNILPSNK